MFDSYSHSLDRPDAICGIVVGLAQAQVVCSEAIDYGRTCVEGGHSFDCNKCTCDTEKVSHHTTFPRIRALMLRLPVDGAARPPPLLQEKGDGLGNARSPERREYIDIPGIFSHSLRVSRTSTSNEEVNAAASNKILMASLRFVLQVVGACWPVRKVQLDLSLLTLTVR